MINISLSLKKTIQESRSNELKLCHLFRLCIWIGFMLEYMMYSVDDPNQSHIIAFFVRDIVSYVCNTIRGESSIKIKLAIGKIIYDFKF